MNRKLLTISLVLPASLVFASCARDAVTDDPANEPDPATTVTIQAEGDGVHINAVTEAPTGFDNLTNGFVDQTTFDGDKDTFEEFETIADGLGPVYNTQSCRECHQNPVTGAGSQITELRTGHFNGTSFVDPPGGSLNNDRAIDASIQERTQAGQE